MRKEKVDIIWSDGSCLGNPGWGGWCFLLNDKWLVSGSGRGLTTNNRMEMMAVIEGLKWSQAPRIRIYSDSQLVIKCAQGVWKRKKNKDLWSEFEEARGGRPIEWNWVKGHSGNPRNELVDRSARREAETILRGSNL